ncbi:restriction endonuclease subunit S [Enterococcus hirae]|nr:restriction endonuclease subunit S [Enterococcus faecium]EMF0117573.1 restriction endonuclease subunit S [Enterococcus hirae]
MSNNAQPEIRFPGFTEGWEQHKLIEVARYRNGKAHEQAIDESGKYIVVNSKFVSTNGRVKKYTNIIIDPLKKNELAFVLSDVPNGKAIARTFLVDKEHRYSLNQRIAGITPHKDTDSYFLNVLMNRNPYFLKFDNGVGQTNLTKADVENFIGHYPSYEEQQKIGTFFKQLDDTIALHQRKLDLLKETKKGFLQKMFPKNGAKVPEIRFPGFTEDWEQRKFKEFSKKTGKKNTKDLDFPAYSVSNKAGLISQTEQFDGSRLDDLEKTNYKFVEPNEFAYNPARVNVGSIAFNNLGMTVIVSSLYVVVKMSEDLDNEFILQFIKSPTFIKEVKRNTEGSVREYLFYENFANIKFPFTRNKEEQQKIGAFFKQLDDTIALHQRKLDLLKETKKGFLQKMFV